MEREAVHGPPSRTAREKTKAESKATAPSAAENVKTDKVADVGAVERPPSPLEPTTESSPTTNAASESDAPRIPSPPPNTLNDENEPPSSDENVQTLSEETIPKEIALSNEVFSSNKENGGEAKPVAPSGREGFRVYRSSVTNEEALDVLDGEAVEDIEPVVALTETVASEVMISDGAEKSDTMKEESAEVQPVQEEEECGIAQDTPGVYYTEIDSPESEDMMPTFGLERTVDGAVSDLQTELRMAESMTETEAVIDLQSELMMAESMHEQMEQIEQEGDRNRVVEGSESTLTDVKQTPLSPIVRSESDLNTQRNRIIEGAEAEVPENLNQTEITENENKRKSLILPRSKEESLSWEGEDFKQDGLMPSAPHLYPKLEEIQDADIKPLTDEQLKSLYYNGEMESLDDFVEEFLKVCACLLIFIA